MFLSSAMFTTSQTGRTWYCPPPPIEEMQSREWTSLLIGNLNVQVTEFDFLKTVCVARVSRWCRCSLLTSTGISLSAGRVTDHDAKGLLAFAQLPKLEMLKTPRQPPHVGDAGGVDSSVWGSGHPCDSDNDDHLLVDD